MGSDAFDALAARQKVQQFLNAARNGNVDLLKQIACELDEGKGLSGTVADIKDANNRSALHFAAREGKTEVCRFLLEELKLDVDAKDDDGETPLLHAARQDHLATSIYLLERGASPSTPSSLGATPLHHAAGIGNTELVKFLLSQGVNVDSQSDAGTPLIWAVGHGQPATAKILLEHGADPNAETDDSITPLLSAVAAGSLPCLEMLIQAGANSNMIAGGTTSLHIAADSGNAEILHCLLKAGADPNARDECGFKGGMRATALQKEGLTPLEVAAERRNHATVEILFPSTSPIQRFSDWSVDGIINQIKCETYREEVRSSKRTDTPKDTNSLNPETVKVSSEAKKSSLEAKARGDEAFKRKDYLIAIDAYTQAIDLDPTNAVLLSNRSLCWIRLGQADQALVDAKACRKFEEAANAFYDGVKLDPENKELVDAFREAVEAGRKFHGVNQKK